MVPGGKYLTRAEAMSAKAGSGLSGGANHRTSTMSKIVLKPYVSKSGKIIPSVSIDALLEMAGIEAPDGYAVPQGGKVILVWEPKAEAAQAKRNGIMGKPLAKLAKPDNGGAEEKVSDADLSGLKAELAILTKAVSMLMKPEHISDLIGQTNPIAREAPVGTTITRKRKTA